MRTLFSAFAILIFAAGCNVQTGLAPVEPVITNSTDREFGFVGVWHPAESSGAADSHDSYEFAVTKGEIYNATAIDPSTEADRQSAVQFHAREISPHHPHAVVELIYKYDEKHVYRRLAIAAVLEDQLHLWTIDGKKIAEHLYEEEVTAVIEHSTFSSSIRCDGKQLLEAIKKHSGEIVGNVQVFERKK